jgi:glycosyltransferase involved in cell wall biosynthesis
VIIPAYDAAWCLPEALASLMAQTYHDWEAIVADDGSRDGTPELAEGLDPRIRVVRSPVNRGLASTRNLALEHAVGELVALLDSDDAWLPEYLTEQVALFDAEQSREPNVAVVCCDAFQRVGDSRIAQTYWDRVGYPPPQITLNTLVRFNPIFIGVLLDRARVEAAGRFDPGLRSVEDLDLWLRLLEDGGRIVCQRRPLAVYRLSEGALSRDVVTMTRSLQVVLEGALRRGRLPAGARTAAKQALRTQRAAEQLELARRELRERPLAAGARLTRSAPLLARVVGDRVRQRATNRRRDATRSYNAS